MRTEYKVIILSVVLALSYHIIDAFTEYFLFHQNSFLEVLTSITGHEIVSMILTISLFLGFGIIVTEILSRRRQAEAKLRESESKLRAILEHTPALVAIKDLQGRYLMVNEQLEGLLSSTQDELIGKTDIELFGEEKGREFVNNDRTVIENSEPMNFNEDIFIGGRLINYLSVKFPLYDNSGKKYAICCIAADITKEKTHDRQMLESEKFSALSTLAAGVAHEFKNALAGILGNATHLMESIEDNDPVASSLRNIVETAEQANKIASALLSYSAKNEESRGLYNLGRLVTETSSLMEGSFRMEYNIETVTNIETSQYVEICRWQIQQVILNAILNAKEAIPKEGGTIVISVYSENRYAHLSIADSGKGIPAENLSKIFDPFFSTKGVWGPDKGSGTGLGLTWIKNIIENHNGEIKVASKEDMGTNLIISLPLVDEDKRILYLKNAINEEVPIIVFSLDDKIIEHIEEFEPVGTPAFTINSLEVLRSLVKGVCKALLIFDATFPGKSELIKSIKYCAGLGEKVEVLIVNHDHSENDLLNQIVSKDRIFENVCDV
ncbi:MAG: PAS domain-containing protein [candidate division Zixibacteria bacterium]|nr:PAS domain-containing protein [candidate division Zixibacteria bacterium]